MFHFDNLAQKLLRKDFWQGLIAGQSTEGDGSKRFTAEELRNLYDILHRNPVVNEGNKALVVETVRSVAEFLIWGDQHEPRIFEFFMENNIMVYLHKILQQPANRSGEVAKQVLQTLGIIIQNVRSETGIYFLFSNNHINNIVGVPFDFEDEEVLGFYISFLKAISLKLTPQTVQFFVVDDATPQPPQPGTAGDQSAGQELTELGPAGAQQQEVQQEQREDTSLQYTLPLYTEAIKFAHHHEGMVRAGVRTLTLNVLSVQDTHIQAFVTRQPAASYFTAVAEYLVQQVQILDRCMAAAQSYGQQQLSQLDSQIAEVEDMLSYCNDVFMNGHPYVAHLLSAALWQHLVGPCLLRPLVGSIPDGQGKQQAVVTPVVQAATALYVLERCFALISYTALVNNLAVALLALPQPAHQHDTPATTLTLCSFSHVSANSDTSPCIGLLHLLNLAQPHTTAAALRCLVALAKSPAVSAELMVALGLRHSNNKGQQQQGVPLSPTGPDHCSVCRLLVQLHGDCKECRSHAGSAITTQAGTQEQRLLIAYYTPWSITQPPKGPEASFSAAPNGVHDRSDNNGQLSASPAGVQLQAAQTSEGSSSFSSAVTGASPPGGAEDASADPLATVIEQPALEKPAPVQQEAGPPLQPEQQPPTQAALPSPTVQPAAPSHDLLLLDDHDSTPASATTPQAHQAADTHDLLPGLGDTHHDSTATGAKPSSSRQPPLVDLLTSEPPVQVEQQQHIPEEPLISAAAVPPVAQPPLLEDLLSGEDQPVQQEQDQEQQPSQPAVPTPASQPASPAHPLESQLELLWRDPPPGEGEQGKGQPIAEGQEPEGSPGAHTPHADFASQGMAVNGFKHGPAEVNQQYTHVAPESSVQASPSGMGCLLHYQQVLDPDSIAARLLRALVSVLQGTYVPVQAIWTATHLLMAWFVRPADLLPTAEASDAAATQHPVQQERQGEDTDPLADPLQTSTGKAAGAGAGTRDAVPLDESTKAELMASLTSAAGAALEGLQEMWAEAFFPLLGLEWSVACESIKTPVLRTSAHLLMMGPHLFPHPGSGHTSMGTSAVSALRLVHLVQRLVAVLQMGAVVRTGGVQASPPLTFTQDLERRTHEVIEGQQVEMTQDKAVACQVSFAVGQEKRVYYTVTGAALAALDMLQRGVTGGVGINSHSPALSRVADPGALQAELLHSSPAIVLAEPAPTRLHAGVVLSSAPLMGAQLYADPNNPRWLHIHVRPSVRGLLKVWRQAQSRKGGLPNQLRSLADGHWVLQFQDGDRVVAAIAMAQQELNRLQAAYREHAGAAINSFINTLLG